MYNLRDPKQRKRYLRATMRRRDSNFAASEKIIRAVFRKERARMLSALPKVGKVDTQAWTNAFKRIWVLSGENAWKFNEDVWGIAQRRQRGEAVKPKPKAIEAMWLHYKQVPAWMAYVNDYIDDKGASKIKGIEDTTREAVRDALKEGIANDESIPDLAARISKTYDGFEDSRSTMIARSETIEAFNRGSQAQAKEAGSTLDNMWIATMDDRTREEHEAMDGVTVPYDEEFDCEDGTTWPGDAVNCRCTIGYAVPKEVEEPISEERAVEPNVYTDYNDSDTKDAVEYFYENLPKDESDAIATYIKGDQTINSYLRTGEDLFDMSPKEFKQIDLIKDVIDKAPKYDGITYRGVDLKIISDEDKLKHLQELSSLTKGDTITLKGFTSTSIDKDIATHFAGSSRQKGSFILQIEGKSGAILPQVTGEGEVLYNDKTTFEVIGSTILRGGGRDIILRVL